MYKRKTYDEYNLMGNYGYGDGLEVLTCEESYSEAKQRMKEYRENDNSVFQLKIVCKRVKIEVLK